MSVRNEDWKEEKNLCVAQCQLTAQLVHISEASSSQYTYWMRDHLGDKSAVISKAIK